MTDLQRLLDERSCTALLLRYCALIDDGAAAEVPALFAPDGTWSLGSATVRGTGELRETFDQRQAAMVRVTRHVLSNVEVDVEEDTATGRGYLTAYRHNPQDGDDDGHRTAPLERPMMVGDLRARFVRADGRWLVAELATTPVFRPRRPVAAG